MSNGEQRELFGEQGTVEVDVWAPAPRVPRRVDPDVEQAGKVGRDHPTTAKRAAVRGRVGFASERALVLRFVAGSEHGATAADIADTLHRSRNQIATRLLELREQRWIEYQLDDAGQAVKRSTGRGHEGLVHVMHRDAWPDFVDWQLAADAHERAAQADEVGR